jgi:peptidoglycan/LPS O-acetylase OafA/YrhL
MKYRSDIDGLRAIAVIAVVLFHAFPTLLPSGFIGVDIFFVISGYLISYSIFENLEKNTFSFYDFYKRRIRRIFPALILVLIFCLVIGWLFFLSNEYKELGIHVAAGAGFVENFIYWKNINYFDTASIQKPLLHLWSLAIEEQFYILWPCIAWLVYRTKLGLFIVILTFIVLSFFSNIVTQNFSITASYYLPQNRFWELGIGCLCAWLDQKSQKFSYISISDKFNTRRHSFNFYSRYFNFKNIYSSQLAFLGITLLLIAFLILNKSYIYPGWWALLPTLGTAFIIIAGSSAFPNRIILSDQILVKVGLISFPLYMWHWPILTFAFIIDPQNYTREVRVCLIIISFILAWATYVFLERPIRKSALSFKISFALSLVLLFILFAGLLIYKSQGFPERIFSKRFSTITDAYNDWDFPGKLIRETTSADNYYWKNSDQPPLIAFIGDSHIEQFAPRILNSNNWKNTSVIFITENGCPPIPNVFESAHKCENFIPRITNILNSHSSIKSIVIGGCWNCYFILETQKIPDINNFDYYYSENNFKYKFRNTNGSNLAIKSLQSFLEELSNKYKVFFLLDNPLHDSLDPRSMVGNRLKINSLSGTNLFVSIDLQQKILNNDLNKVSSFSHASSIDQISILCPGDLCKRFDINGLPIYKDNHHLRSSFARNSTSYIDIILDSIETTK